MSAILAGIDEAGYGPVVGPLVVSLYAVEVPSSEEIDLWRALADCSRRPPRPRRRKKRGGARRRTSAARRRAARILVGDSKEIYSPAIGPFQLERSALSLAAWAHGRGFDSAEDLLRALVPAAERAADEPWEEPSLGRFPLCAETLLPVPPLRPAATEVRPFLAASRILAPAPFNRLTRAAGTKAAVTWSAIEGFIASLLERADGRPIRAVVDRQGGRHYYGEMLQRAFAQLEVETVEESPRVSTYRVGPALEVSFRVRADAGSWTVAAASILSKYVREIMMSRLNAWARGHLPDLRPTAGYYLDGRRFVDETRPLRRRLGIADERFVRLR